MNLEMKHVDVWSAEVADQAGGLALALRAIADYGADLDCVIARREHGKPGKGLVFVSPLSERDAYENASEVGLRRLNDVPTLRVEGTDAPGMAAKLARTVADAGVNLHGFSAMTLGHRFVCYLGFESAADREKAEAALKALGEHHWHLWPHRSEKARAEVGAAW